MRVKSLVGMIAAALVALAYVVLAPRPSTPPPAAELPFVEKPWLARAAADQIIGPNGTLGPLFAGVTLGGPAPSREIRDRIAAFARANDVTIDFEITDDELVAIRFDVTFGGCCGYEGVDVLAARIGQPKHYGGCGMGDSYYYNNWAIAHEDGTHVRGTVRVNRLSLRWERIISLDDVVAKSESMLGSDRGTISATARERWFELEPQKHYLLEVPYAFVNESWQPARSQPAERGIQVVADRRIITEVTFTTLENRAHLKARWGRPRINADDEWTWHRTDRTIVARFGDPKTTITLALR